MRFKRKIKKYIIALFLLVLSAYGAMVIKDEVDAANPEYSLPIITVTVEDKSVYVVRAGYNWKFGRKKAITPYVSAHEVPLVATECLPDDEIKITFSAPVQSITLYQGDGWEDDDFFPVARWNVPEENGLYLYRLNAEFASGDINYYFALQVKKK